MFANRAEAGRRLAGSLAHLAGGRHRRTRPGTRRACRSPTRVARALGAPLDVIVVRKLGRALPARAGHGCGRGGGRARPQPRGGTEPRTSARPSSRPPSSSERMVVAERAQRVSGPGIHASRSKGGRRCSSRTASPPGRPPAGPASWPGRLGADRVVLAAPVGPDGAEKQFLEQRRRGGRASSSRRAFQAVGQVYRDFGADQRRGGLGVTAQARRRPALRAAGTLTEAARQAPDRSLDHLSARW